MSVIHIKCALDVFIEYTATCHYYIHGGFFLLQNAYSKYKVITAAQGCKIIAKDLEKALAGLPLYVAHKPDEVEIYKVSFRFSYDFVYFSDHVWID